MVDTGVGPPFLWGHGFASSSEQEASGLLDWERLSARYRIVRWDARGHGRSQGTTNPDHYRWDNLGGDSAALLDALAVEQAVLGGVSMGAATALHAAARAPERAAGLVLALPPTAFATRAAQAREYDAGAQIVEERGVQAYVEQANTRPPPEILQSLASGFHFVPAVPDELLPAVLRGAAASDLPPPDVIRSIQAPVLILAWDGDADHPLSTAEHLAALLPAAQLVVAPDLRAVASWTRRVEGFLDRVFRPGPRSPSAERATSRSEGSDARRSRPG